MEIQPVRVVRGAATVSEKTLQIAAYLAQHVPASLRNEAQSIQSELQSTNSWSVIRSCEDRLEKLAKAASIDLKPQAYETVSIPDVYLRVDALHPGPDKGNVNVRLESLVEDLPAFQTTLVQVSQADIDRFVNRFESLNVDERAELGRALEEQAGKTKQGKQLRAALLLLLGASFPALGAMLGLAGSVGGLLLTLMLGLFYGNTPADYVAKPSDALEKLASA